MRCGQHRLEKARNAHSDPLGVCLRQVQQHDYSQIEVRIALKGRVRSEPLPAVSDSPVTALFDEVPPESVGIRSAVVQTNRSPAHVEPGSSQYLRVIEAECPLCEVARREAEAATCGGIDAG